MPAKRALLITLLLLLFILPLTIALSKKPTKTTSRGATETPGSNRQEGNSSEPPYVKNELIVKFKDPKRVIENDAVKTFSQLDQSNLPSSIIELNQSQEIKSIEKVFKTAAIAANPSQEVMPSEKVILDTEKVFKITFAEEIEPAKVIRELRSNPEVEYAEPNYIYQTCLTPNDPYFLDSYPSNVGNRDPNWNPPYDYQWNLKKIKIDQAYDLEKEGQTPVLVAVIDTGVDYTHPDFGSCSLEQVSSNTCQKIAPGWNFITNTPDPKDDHFHGTHVAGIINAVTSNGLGIASFEKNNILRILPIKSLGQDGKATADILAAAIGYAVNHGAKVINMSWGGPGESQTINQVITNGLERNVVFVAAAGNDNTDVAGFFPAATEGVLAVSATDQNDTLASYSNFGGKIAVSAPGGSAENNLLSLTPVNLLDLLPPDQKELVAPLIVNQSYLRISGTSMAAPHVSGLAGLIKSQDPSLDNQKIRNIIENSADDLGATGFDIQYGYGRINAARSLLEMKNTTPPKASLQFPLEGLVVGLNFEVHGKAYGYEFQNYNLNYSTNPGCDRQNVGFTSEGIALNNPNQPKEETGLLGTTNLPLNSPEGKDKKYCLKLQVNTNDANTETITTFYLDKMVSPGWPRTGVSMLIADVNGNETNDAVWDYRGKIFAVDFAGQDLPGFPIPTGATTEFFALPAAWGQKVFLPVLFQQGSGYGQKILGWDGRTGQALPEWQEQELLGVANSIALADIDLNQRKEIVFGDFDPSMGSGRPKLYVFDENRQPLPGWEGGVPFPDDDRLGTHAPLVGNVSGNQNSPLEIVTLTRNEEGYTRIIGIYNLSGNLQNHFEAGQGQISNAALGDLDGDGLDEIIVVDRRGYISAWESDGTRMWEYRIENEEDPSLFALALANFDQDPSPEAFTCNVRGTCVAVNSDGHLLPGFPTQLEPPQDYPPTPITASIAKLRNGHLFILLDSSFAPDGALYALDYHPQSGQISIPSGFPKSFATNTSAYTWSPTVSDLNNDQKIEIVFSLEKKSTFLNYVLTTNFEVERVEWEQYYNDAGHTGAYHPPQAPPPPTCRTCENFTGCLVGKTCLQICQTNPSLCESKACEGEICDCRSGAPVEFRCPN
ncbi:MAG: S8 family peptidase [bacterium]|nr:S8 family peptidase [bacterium]